MNFGTPIGSKNDRAGRLRSPCVAEHVKSIRGVGRKVAQVSIVDLEHIDLDRPKWSVQQYARRATSASTAGDQEFELAGLADPPAIHRVEVRSHPVRLRQATENCQSAHDNDRAPRACLGDGDGRNDGGHPGAD